jgi:hypothetical protein
MYQDCEIVEQDCESSEWVELTEGTFKECEDYQKKDEAKQLEYGISVDYKKRERVVLDFFNLAYCILEI